MPRTTTRRAATGLGALAATTALALAAPSASAATSSVDLSPAAEDVYLGLSAYPTSSDLQDSDDYAPLPTSGEVSVAIPDLVSITGALSAEVYELDDYEDAYDDEELEPVATTEDVTEFTVAPGVDGSSTVEVVLPVDLLTERSLDEVVVLVEGLSVDGFPDGPVLDFAVEATPPADAGRDDEVPLRLEADLVAGASLEEVVEATAGQAFELVLPEESSLGDLGVTSLEDAELFLYPYDDFAWMAAETDEAGASDAEPLAAAPAGAAAAASLAAGADVEEAVAAADVDYEDLELDVEVSEDGRRAQVTPSTDLTEGEYFLELLLPSSEGDSVLTFVLGDVELEAAQPEPMPTVTVTQPAPTVTVAPAPVKQNPGLRSNTGVEAGAVDGGLLAAGAGLLALAAGAGAVALRTGRRGRRA